MTFDPNLEDALLEIESLRLSLAMSVIGSRVIVQQLERAEDSMLKWACNQARHNAALDQAALNRSKEEFPL